MACCYHMQAWAARYNTCLLFELMPKGAVFSFPFLFFPFSFDMQTHRSCCLVRSCDYPSHTDVGGGGPWKSAR